MDSEKSVLEICGKISMPTFSTKFVLSVSKGQKFLREMKNTSTSKCNCLPDCELMDLQHSVSTTNLM